MKKLSIEQRKQRILARGEHSNHCHVVTGDVNVYEKNGKTYIEVGEDSSAVLKHLLETEWLKGNETWTKEHQDIPLEKGTYEFVQQVEYNPLDEMIRAVKD